MPNWCQNVLLLKGPTAEVSRLLETVQGEDKTSLSLAKIIAVPEELKQLTAPNRDEDEAERLTRMYGAKDWYMLAKQFPKVKIHHAYDESGSDFSGYRMYIGGECVEFKDWESWTNVRMYLEPDEDIFDYFPTREGNVNETVSLTDNV